MFSSMSSVRRFFVFFLNNDKAVVGHDFSLGKGKSGCSAMFFYRPACVRADERRCDLGRLCVNASMVLWWMSNNTNLHVCTQSGHEQSVWVTLHSVWGKQELCFRAYQAYFTTALESHVHHRPPGPECSLREKIHLLSSVCWENHMICVVCIIVGI